jgi:PAS domain-containing protein
VSGVLSVARDITLIKQGARAVAEQERLIDTMFSQTTDAIVLVDPETLGFVTFNANAWQGLGYSREAFAACAWDMQAEMDARRSGPRWCAPWRARRCARDPSPRRRGGCSWSTDAAPGRLCRRPLICAVWRDITEAKQRETRFQRLNQAYAVLSGVNEAIVRIRDQASLSARSAGWRWRPAASAWRGWGSWTRTGCT